MFVLWLGPISYFVTIIAAALAVLIVMKIDGRQEEGFSRGPATTAAHPSSRGPRSPAVARNV